MELYTYIMELRGGTYVAQVEANNISDSVFKWIEQIEREVGEIKYIGNRTISELKQMFLINLIDEPIKLNRVSNVWYLGIYCKVGKMLINIVNTKQI
ncbi:MAG: hypothetical protein Q8904_08325 [Bacteroidota bacterium]|nr:hypothetical protein [Bacteroidota bacterium]